MKSFFGSFFGALFAVLILLAAAIGVVFLSVGALQKAGQKTPDVLPNSLLVVDLSVPITDAPAGFDPSQFLAGLQEGGGGEARVVLRDVLSAIEHAANDRRIAGVFVTGTVVPTGYASGYGALREVRQALERFQAAKKPVYAFAYYPTTRSYYVQSVAEHIFMDPGGTMAVSGLASQRIYYSSLLKKLGVGVQVTRVGKYKSAVEPYLFDKGSPEDREQSQKLLDDLWGEVTGAVERSRGLPPGTLQQVVSRYGLIDAEAALEAKLVTEVVPLNVVIDRLRTQYGPARRDETFRQIGVPEYVATFAGPKDRTNPNPKIAVVYAEGDIVDGEGTPDNVGGDRYARAIRKFRLDPSVSGIVLRVNSPGGSVSGSSVIRNELAQAAAAKPVMVSFGTVAASGGYYISSVGSKIFAEPNTITGSIGVFGLFLNFQKLANDNGVNFDAVQTSPFATILSPLQPKNDAELAILQRAVDKDYGEFLKLVSTSRGVPVEQINEIAQGRVWSGSEAVRLHLADEVGGLDEAVAALGKQVGLGERPALVEYPAKPDLNERLKELLNGVERPPVAKLDPLRREWARFEKELVGLRNLNDPRGVYALLPLGFRVE